MIASQKNISIGIDLDDVVLRYREWDFLDYCAGQYGWDVDKKEFAETHSWESATGGKTSVEIGKAFVQFMTTHPEVQNIVPGAQKALQRLADMHCPSYAITARPRPLAGVTIHTLAKFKVRHLLHAFITWGVRLQKAQVIRERNISVHVEDDVCEIKAIVEGDVDVTVIQFPSFRGGKQAVIGDSRVHRLDACNHVQDADTMACKTSLWEDAWSEAIQVIKTRAVIAA